MQASTVHSITTVQLIEVFYIDSFEDGFGLPDGVTVTYWQAYDPVTNRPVGPRGGDMNPAYVRLWMADKHPTAIECQITMAAP